MTPLNFKREKNEQETENRIYGQSFEILFIVRMRPTRTSLFLKTINLSADKMICSSEIEFALNLEFFHYCIFDKEFL